MVGQPYVSPEQQKMQCQSRVHGNGQTQQTNSSRLQPLLHLLSQMTSVLACYQQRNKKIARCTSPVVKGAATQVHSNPQEPLASHAYIQSDYLQHSFVELWHMCAHRVMYVCHKQASTSQEVVHLYTHRRIFQSTSSVMIHISLRS